MAGIEFHTVPACFLEGDSHPRSKEWMGYLFRTNEANYYVTGDTQALPEMAKLKVDVLMPLLYGCGANIEQAVKMAKLTKARVVVPVHHSGQQETLRRCVAELPEHIQCAYYVNGKLVSDRD